MLEAVGLLLALKWVGDTPGHAEISRHGTHRAPAACTCWACARWAVTAGYPSRHQLASGAQPAESGSSPRSWCAEYRPAQASRRFSTWKFSREPRIPPASEITT